MCGFCYCVYVEEWIFCVIDDECGSFNVSELFRILAEIFVGNGMEIVGNGGWVVYGGM